MTSMPEPIAIIGLALRFPGAETLEAFWDIIASGEVKITELPQLRRSAGFPPDRTFWGGFVDAADEFDPLFFGISAREAKRMDPQQRFILEMAWNALEDAAIAPSRLSSRQVGVFMGACHWDYLEMQARAMPEVEAHMATGISQAVLSNRVSYFFNFTGPSVTNDTACSSALVAIEQAVQALRAGSCMVALAGGANLIWSPDHFLAFSKAGMLSKSGTSRAFDARADGYVRGEGAAVVVLKPLAQALVDGDPIHAVIREVASNHGGNSAGLTVTNPTEQAALITRVLLSAGVSPETLGYVEAHGTGTPIGDPIEIRGLKTAMETLYAEAGLTPSEGVTRIGSVKNNIGHLEGAAGIAGVAKVVAALKHAQIPPTAGFEKPNPLLRLAGTPLRIADRLEPWPASEDVPRRAGVSSFGFGGTNAHALIEEFRAGAGMSQPAMSQPVTPQSGWPILLSARSEAALKRRCRDLAHWLERNPEAEVAAIASSLTHGRETMAYRAAMLTKGEELRDQLTAIATGSALPAAVWTGHADEEKATETVVSADMLDQLAAWVNGAVVDWTAQVPVLPRLHLPGYVFERTSHWFEPLVAPAPAITPAVEDLRFDLTEDGAHLHIPASHPYLSHHIIGGVAILPGVVTLSYVARAFASVSGSDFAALRDVVWQRPARATETGVDLTILRQGEDGFIVHDEMADVVVRGRMSMKDPQPVADVPSESGTDLGLPYERLVSVAIEHGPAFRAVRTMAVAAGQVVGKLDLPAAAPLPDTAAHPVLLDAALQTIVSALFPGEAPGVPFAVERFDISNITASQAVSLCRRRMDGRHDVDVVADGQTLARIYGLATRPVSAAVTSEIVVAEPQAATISQVPVLDAAVQGLMDASPADDFVLVGTSADTPRLLSLPRAQTADDDAQSLHDGLWLVLSTLRDWIGAGDLTGLWIRPGASDFGACAIPLIRTMALEGGGIAVALSEPSPTMSFARAQQSAARRDDVEGAVVLITGGAGAIGRAMAQTLMQRKAKTVILAGRTAPRDTDFPFVVCDVADPSSLRAALDQIIRDHGRLDGVIHSAGLIEDGMARTKERQSFDRVLAPKIDGLLALDAETAAMPLRFFLVNSSIAAVHGAIGQSDYAAANAYLNRFMQKRAERVAQKERSGHSLSIGWTLWAGGGMQVSDRVMRGMKRRMGTDPLPLKGALSIFLDVLDGALPPRIQAGYGDAERFIRFLCEGDEPVAVPTQAQAPASVPARPDQAQPEASELRTALLDRLVRMLAETLGMDATTIRPGIAFERYGFDSLLAVEMVEKLEKWLGTDLSATLFFETINLNGVADYLLRKCPEILPGLLQPTVIAARPAQALATPTNLAETVAASEPVMAVSVAASSARPDIGAPSVHTRPRDRDIAVIGLAGRYPGAATLERFWENLAQGRHSFTPVPQDRWPHQDIYFPEREVLGKSTIQTGGFLDDIDKFDPRYFNISQAEAERMSPEVRLLLECAVETFEQAGYSRETLQAEYGGDVGVLVGTMSNHYNLYGFQNMLMHGARASGSYTGTMPNMISYFYGLTGPSIFVDTMCSASLTALDLAVRLLREGQCRMVLAGGVNLLLHPYNLISSSQEHFTSNRAEVIRSFGLGADGTILGEGVGTALLKPLAAAERDGDLIQAVIVGTAMANAGPRNGFTVPSPAMQARAVRGALADARLSPADISYIETHGSGTKLGDPIEIAALQEVFGSSTEVALGSVKSNIAHLLAAAGIAGFTKLVLQLRNAQIAPSLHSDQLNPAIPFHKTPFRVNQTLSPWTETEAPRRAGITSIGAGGMNNHMIVEEYRTAVAQHLPVRPVVMPFSALSLERLGQIISRMIDWIDANPSIDPQRVAYTLQMGRTALRCRAAVVAQTLSDLRERLVQMREGDMTQVAYCADVMAEPPRAPLTGRDAESLARNWVRGEEVDWAAEWSTRPLRIELPAYPFERIRCWYEVDPDAPSVLRPEVFRRRLHPLIGTNRSNLKGVHFQTLLRADDMLDYVSRRNGEEWISPLLLTDAALAALDLAGHPAFGLTAIEMAIENLAEAETIELFVADGGAVEIRQGDRIIFRATATNSATPIAGSKALLVPEADPAPLLAEAGISHRPYGRGIEHFTVTSDGRFAATVVAATHRQDYDRKHTRLSPEAITAIEDCVRLAAHAAGLVDWAALNLVSVDELLINAVQSATVRIDGILLAKDGGVRVDLTLTCATGHPVAQLTGLYARSGDQPEIRKHRPETWEPTFGKIGFDNKRREYRTVSSPADDTQAPSNVGAALNGQSGQTALREIVAGTMKFDIEQVDIFTRFYDFGFDSISLAALADAVNHRFGSKLTPAVFYDVANIAQLAAQLGDPIPRQSRPAAAKPVAAHGPAITEMAGRLTEAAGTVPIPVAGTEQPIAIIGMSCRVPGANGTEAFDDLLFSSRFGLSSMPEIRYGRAELESIAAAGLPPKGGFLSDIARFDAEFFQISPAEADVTDPQHRLMLEAVWHALEDAALVPSRLPQETGVFIGVSGNDYREMMQRAGVPASGYVATGTSLAMLANRISFLLDLTGPSSAIDTACSSSLVAVHRAVLALRRGDCALALAGGVNIALTPEGFIGPMQGGMLSPDGECRTFSARANGYVRGEGVGVVVLKPLAQAMADGDPIHAVIYGSAENHGGRAGSITAPRIGAQSAVIRAAMTGIDPARVGCVEAHGTGTELGDPVELDALNRAYAELAAATGRVLSPGSIMLSAVKPAIGHLEAAAGIAGLIKLVLCRKRGRIAASLLGQPENPYLNFSQGPFRTLSQPEDWPLERPLAGVSSFGFGGVNAHVVIGPASDDLVSSKSQPREPSSRLIVLSAQTETALRARARDLSAWIDRQPMTADLHHRIADTLQSGRVPMRIRAAFVSRDLSDLRTALAALADGQDSGWVRGAVAGCPLFDPAARVAASLPLNADAATAAAWCAGAEILPLDETGSRLHLPIYPFEGQAHWFRAPVAETAVRRLPQADPAHRFTMDLLDRFIDGQVDAAEALLRVSEDVI
ncbi:SDR family NAD(P)-dependent oxidoreductase (plasmid) [Agrobacterium vitis]|uniref:SDR family NAD(P)-dependent oxidoreductase n=1 Tax=Agrobacterium vitis TaxID=373 RepID=UPI003D29AC6D